jgi:hypothetical protein
MVEKWKDGKENLRQIIIRKKYPDVIDLKGNRLKPVRD